MPGPTADRSDTRRMETLDGVDPSGIDGLRKLAEGPYPGCGRRRLRRPPSWRDAGPLLFGGLGLLLDQ